MGEFKNSMHQFTDRMVNASYERNKMSNKISSVVCLVISIILGVVSLIVFFFSWKAGLVFLGIALLFFGFSRLAKLSNKWNNKFQKKYNEKYAYKEDKQENI